MCGVALAIDVAPVPVVLSFVMACTLKKLQRMRKLEKMIRKNPKIGWDITTVVLLNSTTLLHPNFGGINLPVDPRL